MCSVPPSAQGLLQGHTHSDGVRRVEGRMRRVYRVSVGSVEVRVMRVEGGEEGRGEGMRRAGQRARKVEVRGS